jgi:hypothetical protein
VHRPDQHAEIVAEDFAENFVPHGHVCFAPHTISELCLNRHDGRFDVGTLVVVPAEFLAVQAEVVERLAEQPAHPASDAGAERNVRRHPVRGNRFKICDARFPFVASD